MTGKGRREVNTKCCWGSMQGEEHFEYIDICGRIILKWI